VEQKLYTLKDLNTLKATITKIKSIQNLNIVTFETQGTELLMVSLELHSSLKVGSEVLLGCKATAVTIATEIADDSLISFNNIIPLEIKTLEVGKILTTLTLKKPNLSLESIITTEATNKMGLEEKMRVYALINASDLSIMEIL